MCFQTKNIFHIKIALKLQVEMYVFKITVMYFKWNEWKIYKNINEINAIRMMVMGRIFANVSTIPS